MKKLKKFWLENSVLLVLLLILIACLISISIVVFTNFVGDSSSKYGERLEGIEKHEFSNKMQSEIISKILDDIDPISEEYFLEVASSGERELNDYNDYLKALNKYILVEVSERVANYDELVGDLVNVSETGIELKINLKGRMKVVSIPFNIIEKAHLTFKF